MEYCWTISVNKRLPWCYRNLYSPFW